MTRKDDGLNPDPHLARVIRNQAKILRNRRRTGEHQLYERADGTLVRHGPDGRITVLSDWNDRSASQN